MKKKIPLALLEALQPIVDKNSDLVGAVKDSNAMFCVVDKDSDSDFYFKVLKQESQGGKLNYLVDCKPKGKDYITSHSVWSELDSVLSKLQKWVELIDGYSKINSIYDDPILRKNQEWFEKKFAIVDEDAGFVSFDLRQQIYLDEYLTSVKAKLLLLQAGKTEDQAKELENLITEAAEVQSNLTNETKHQVIKRLCKLWAKAQRVGLEVIKEIFISTVADLTKHLLANGL